MGTLGESIWDLKSNNRKNGVKNEMASRVNLDGGLVNVGQIETRRHELTYVPIDRSVFGENECLSINTDIHLCRGNWMNNKWHNKKARAST